MNKIRIMVLMSLLVMVVAQPLGINLAHAGPGGTNQCPPGQVCPEGAGIGTFYANSPAGLF